MKTKEVTGYLMSIDNDLDIGHNRNDQDKSFVSSMVWFMVLATPLSWIVAWTMYRVLLYKRREKPAVAFMYSAIVAVIVVLFGILTEALSKFVSVFTDLPNFLDNWTNLIPFMLVAAIIIGLLEGLILISYEAYYMRQNKGNIHDISSWKYKFEYAQTPWEKASRKKKIDGLKNGVFSDDNHAVLGVDVKNTILEKPNPLSCMYVKDAARQTAIFGATGSGKSVTQLSMAYNDIRFGRSMLLIDFKNSPQLASKLATWTKEAGGNFYHFVSTAEGDYDITNSPGQSGYDPLATASVEAAAEIILAMREWDVASNMYRNAKNQLTQTLLNMLNVCDRKKAKGIVFDQGNLYMLATSTNKVSLSNLVTACEGTRMQEAAEKLWQEINTRSSAPLGAYNELAGDLTTLYNSKAGTWLKTAPGKREINLFEAMRNGGNTILFSFSSDTESDYSKLMGSILLGDLNAVSAARRGAAMGKDTLSVYIDEFQVIPPTVFTSLLEKGRESGIAMTIASQSIEQVVAAAGANGDSIKKSIIDTVSNFIIHAGTNYNTAEEFSAIIGKEDKLLYTTESFNKTGPFRELVNRHKRPNARSSVQKDWKLDPSDFQELSLPTENNGYFQEAVIINKAISDPVYQNYKGAVWKTTQLVPNKNIVRDDYYTGVRPEPDVNIEEIRERNLASQKAKMASMSSNNEPDFNIFAYEAEQDEYSSEGNEDYTRIQEYNNNPNIQNPGNFEEFDTFEEIEEEETSDGDFGWDDEETDLVIKQIPSQELPIRKVENIEKPRQQAPLRKVAPEPKRKISGFDDLFDGKVESKSLKEIKKAPTQTSSTNQSTNTNRGNIPTTQNEPSSGMMQGLRGVVQQQKNKKPQAKPPVTISEDEDGELDLSKFF